MAFSDIFPPSGLLCIQERFPSGQFAKPVFFPDAAALEAFVAGYSRNGNIFHAVHSFKFPSDRKGLNVENCKSFIFEVDTQENLSAKELADYQADVAADPAKAKLPTKKSALAHILRVLRANQFPFPSHIVESSAGYHFYWAGDLVLAPQRYQELSRRFKRFLQGTMGAAAVDLTRVSDLASVLRPPGSTHTKAGRQPFTVRLVWDKPVLSTVALVQAIDRLVPVAPGAQRMSAGPSQKTNTLGGSRTTETSFSNLASCNAFKAYYKGRATANREQWRQTLQMVTYTDGGDKAAQLVSKGHPSYDPTATTERYQEAMASRQGPITCEQYCSTLALNRATVCGGCPLEHKSSSPVNCVIPIRPKAATPPPVISLRVQTQQDVDAVISGRAQLVVPDFLKLGHKDNNPEAIGLDTINGDLKYKWRDTSEATESDTPVAAQLIKISSGMAIPLRQYTDKSGIQRIVVNVVVSANYGFTMKEATISCKDTADIASFKTALSTVGVRPKLDGHRTAIEKGWKEYVTWFSDEMNRQLNVPLREHFGFESRHEGIGKFAVGNVAVTEDSKVESIIVGGDAAIPQFKMGWGFKGTIDGWSQVLETYAKHGSAQARVLALAAFAAPLWPLLGGTVSQKSMMVHVYGRTGLGKTGIFALLRSIWGKPDTLDAMNVKDTEKSSYNVVAAYGNLPALYDEMTDIKPDQLSRLVFELQNGMGNNARDSSGSGGLRPNTLEWRTLLISNANKSVHRMLVEIVKDQATLDAKHARILELHAIKPMLPPILHVDGKTPLHTWCTRELSKHHGYAGTHYLQWVQGNKDAIRAELYGHTVENDRRRQTSNTTITDNERVLDALRATIMVAARIINEDLGLWSHTVAQTEVDLNTVLQIQAKAISNMTQRDEIRTFINDNSMHIEHRDPATGVKSLPALNQFKAVQAVRIAYPAVPHRTPACYDYLIAASTLAAHFAKGKISLATVLSASHAAGVLQETAGVQTEPYNMDINNSLPVPCYRFRFPQPVAAVHSVPTTGTTNVVQMKPGVISQSASAPVGQASHHPG